MHYARIRAGSLVAAASLSLLAGGARAADACEVINYSCEATTSPAVERAGRATVMLRIPGANQCTGTLVNNGRGDGRPFILTARHCAGGGDLDMLAGSMEIVYGYEVGCDGVAAIPRSTFGAIHRAVHEDAWLVEALDPPPVADPWFAGLNATSQYGTDYFGVHHGNGRAKQYVEQRVTSGNIVYLVNGLLSLVVSTWHADLLSGSTPHGSSGGALFDSGARVFGTLSAGAICAGDRAGNDYQQLATAWTGDGTAGGSLRPWLDPDSLGFRQLAGRSPEESAPAPLPDAQPEPASSGAGGGGGALPALWPLWLVLSLRMLRRGGCKKNGS